MALKGIMFCGSEYFINFGKVSLHFIISQHFKVDECTGDSPMTLCVDLMILLTVG